MIVEIICHRMGWTDIWYAHPGPWGLYRLITSFHLFWPGSWHAGVWTGPQNDLICVRRCSTNDEAEKYLSPPAPTALLACLRALWRAWRLGVKRKTMDELLENATRVFQKDLVHR